MEIHPRRASIPLAALTLTLAIGAPVWAATEDPDGNNGTVKVAGQDLDAIPDNEPQQRCAFDVEFFGYDGGDYYAAATFEVIPPSGNAIVFSSHVFIGEDAASGAGTSTGKDAVQHYDLNEALWPYQMNVEGDEGVHVRLSVRAPRSIGDDSKYKTFWVKGCEQPPN